MEDKFLIFHNINERTQQVHLFTMLAFLTLYVCRNCTTCCTCEDFWLRFLRFTTTAWVFLSPSLLLASFSPSLTLVAFKLKVETVTVGFVSTFSLRMASTRVSCKRILYVCVQLGCCCPCRLDMRAVHLLSTWTLVNE